METAGLVSRGGAFQVKPRGQSKSLDVWGELLWPHRKQLIKIYQIQTVQILKPSMPVKNQPHFYSSSLSS